MTTDPRGTRRWRELAQRIIARDQVCSVCGTDEGLSVDHITPIALGGAMWDEDNLVAMCLKHNMQKGARVNGQVTDYINPLFIGWERRKVA